MEENLQGSKKCFHSLEKTTLVYNIYQTKQNAQNLRKFSDAAQRECDPSCLFHFLALLHKSAFLKSSLFVKGTVLCLLKGLYVYVCLRDCMFMFVKGTVCLCLLKGCALFVKGLCSVFKGIVLCLLKGMCSVFKGTVLCF